MEIDYKPLIEKGPIYLIVACDGLWDYMSNSEVIGFLKQHAKKSLVSVVGKLIHEVIDQKQGTDNISVIIAKITN